MAKTFYLQIPWQQESPGPFLHLSVSGLRQIVKARKKEDKRKDGWQEQDLEKMHQIVMS